MKQKPIPISTCQNCDPDSWIIEGDSEATYKCKKCKMLITKILRRRDHDESSR